MWFETRVLKSMLLAGWLFSITAAGPVAAADETRFQGVTLRVGTWGGATRDGLRDYVASEIEKRGGKVEFVIGSPQDNFAKLIVSRGQLAFDAFDFLGTMVPEIRGRDLLAKLDLKSVPNVKFLQSDQYNDYMVATWNTQEVIIYNKDKFRDNNLQPPESLADLRNPKLSGRVMIPDISSGGGIEAVGAFALTAGGNEQNIDAGLKLIREIPNLRYWKAGGEVVTQFKSGDIWVAVAHAGWAVRTAYAGVPVATVPARIGGRRGMIKEGYIGVIKGSPNQAAAEFFINTYLSTLAQYEFAVKTGVVPVNAEARAKLDGVPVIKDLVVLDPGRIGNMVKLDPAKIDLSKWNEQWNRMISR
ncbi:MAG: extracellular solute-binding protein [Betaproteobacteria bacterium]|nr:extracellular solute-binding protein [Betaproteobacteria bacterium]